MRAEVTMKILALLFGLGLLIASSGVPAAQPSPRMVELQEALAELGYDPGPADGLNVIGPKTREAITAFQKDLGLTVDGKYSRKLLSIARTEQSYVKGLTASERRKRDERRQRLLAMSEDELIRLIERTSNNDELTRIAALIPERFMALPARRLIAKVVAGEAFSDVVFTVALRQLLYPPTREGIEQFQADIGDETTGELTLGQAFELIRRLTRTRDTKVYPLGLGPLVTIDEDLGWAKVEGTWILEDEEIAYPVNTSEITCDRARRECLVVQADVQVPPIDTDPFNSADEAYYLNVSSQRYAVISWEAGEIIARDRGASSCRVTLLTLNAHSNEVYEVTRNDETPRCRQRPDLFTPPNLEKPQIARLVSGLEAAREFWQKRWEATSAYFNPRVAEDLRKELTTPSSRSLLDSAK